MLGFNVCYILKLNSPSLIKVVDHYENPRNVGSLDKNSKNVGTGLVGAPACGDVMKLQVYCKILFSHIELLFSENIILYVPIC